MDSSIHFLNQALIIAREINIPEFKALTYSNLGKNYGFMGENLKALEYLNLAQSIIDENPNKLIQADIHYAKSVIFITIDRLHLANEHANKALKLYEELNNLEQVSSLYTIISIIYNKLDDPQKSLEYTLKSHEISLLLNDSLRISAHLNNLGTQYYNLNQFDSAFFYLRKAIVLNKQYNIKNWLAINYQNMGKYFLEIGEIDSADMYIEKASDLYQEIGYLIDYYLAQEIKGKILLAKKDTVQAVKFFQSIINSPKHLESLKLKADAYKALQEIAFNQRQYVKANEYYKVYKQFDDSLKTETNTSLLSVLELQIEYEKKQSRLEIENKEIKLNSQRKTFIVLIMAVIILLLCILVYFVYKLQKAKAKTIRIEKKHIEDELKLKNREITANVLGLMKKNEALTEISKSLLEVEKHAVKEDTKLAISKIAEKIWKSRDEEIWEEFDIRFKQVHVDFYNHLVQQFPDLSPSEQRLCAFLRMNMSTKDISELMGINSSSIDNSRSKIRKKLQLSSDINLVTYLTKL